MLRERFFARLEYLELPIPTVLVAPEDVPRGKSAPDPYLKAVEDLGFSLADCLVIRRWTCRNRSALATGAQVLVLATTHEPNALAKADTICPQFSNLVFTADDTGIVVSWDSPHLDGCAAIPRSGTTTPQRAR